MPTHDVEGKEYARVDAVVEGNILIADGDFTCIHKGEKLVVGKSRDGSLSIPCHDGEHGLDGQINDAGTHYVGLYAAPSA